MGGKKFKWKNVYIAIMFYFLYKGITLKKGKAHDDYEDVCQPTLSSTHSTREAEQLDLLRWFALVFLLGTSWFCYFNALFSR